MAARSEITGEWLCHVMREAGYEATHEDDIVKAKHPTRPNIVAKINREVNVIMFQHYWGVERPGWDENSSYLLDAVNKANRQSICSTFYIDADGDLAVSSYIFLTEEVSERDVMHFLEQEAFMFLLILTSSGLSTMIT